MTPVGKPEATRKPRRVTIAILTAVAGAGGLWAALHLFPGFGPGNEPLRNGYSRIRRHTHGGLFASLAVSMQRGRSLCRFDAQAGLMDDLRTRKALLAGRLLRSAP